MAAATNSLSVGHSGKLSEQVCVCVFAWRSSHKQLQANRLKEFLTALGLVTCPKLRRRGSLDCRVFPTKQLLTHARVLKMADVYH